MERQARTETTSQRRWVAALGAFTIALALQAVGAEPSAADHGASEFSFTGDPDDYIGQGQTRRFSTEDGDSVQGQYWHGQVFAWIVSSDSWWNVTIAAPPGEELVVGEYPDAVRAMSQDDGQPGLEVSGEGRGCNQLTGSFAVNEAQFTAGGAIQSFHATLVQHCEGQQPALRGELRIHAPIDTTPPQIWVPDDLTWDAADSDGAFVWYWVSVSDDHDPAPSLECTPPAGSLFSVGTTVVRCTATDWSGNSAEASFQVHVLPPLELTITVEPTGTVDPVTGVATVRLTVACSRDAWVGGSLLVEQDVARRATLRGRAFTSLHCLVPQTTLQAEVLPTDEWTGEQDGRFNAGRAHVEVEAWGCTTSTCTYVSTSSPVRLKGGKG